MKRLRPFFPFYGSKWNTARYYPEPQHRHVVEPFAGSAGYSTFYSPQKVTLIDADPIVVGVWDYLMRADSGEVLRLPDLPTPGDSVDDHDIPQEAKWLIGFWLNRGSASPKRSRTEYSARTDKAQLNWGPRAKQRIIEQLPCLEGWSVRQGSFADSPLDGSATYFVDPPYVDKGRYYRIKFDDFKTLAVWARKLPGQVMVCEQAGADWLPFAPLGSFKSSNGRSKEVIWTGEPGDIYSEMCSF